MAQSILYYPTINIKDSIWLRSAALYWDEVCSIVPYSEYPEFSPEIQYMQERGQYRAIYPQDMLFSQDVNAFMQTLEQRLHKVFSSPYRRSGCLSRIHRNKIYNPDLYTLIHYNKLPSSAVKMIRELEHAGYIRSTDADGWIEMDTWIADVYMRTLAEYVARYDEKDIVIGTDKPAKVNDLYQRSGAHKSTPVWTISLIQSLPVPSMDVGFEELLDFKQNRQDDLYELRRKIRELEHRIYYSESPEEVKSIVIAFKETWQRDLSKAESMFKGDGIGIFLTGLLTFVGNASGAAGLLQGVGALDAHAIPPATFGMAVGTAGLIGVGLQYRSYKKKIRQERQNKGFAYIIGANQRNLLRKIDLL